MQRDAKECELELTQKGEVVSRLQLKASQIGNILQSLENKHVAALAAEAAARGHKPSSGGGGSSSSHQPPVKKAHFIDPIPPFNASRVRKSPSAALMETSACELALQESTTSTTTTTTVPMETMASVEEQPPVGDDGAAGTK